MQLLKNGIQIKLLFFLQPIKLQILVIDQVKFPQCHGEDLAFAVTQDFSAQIKQPGDIYRPVSTFGDSSSSSSSSSSGSGADTP